MNVNKLPENMLLSMVEYSVIDFGLTTWLLYHESDIVINFKIFCRCSTSNSRRVEYSFTNCCTYKFLYEIWNDTYAGISLYFVYIFKMWWRSKQKIIICTNSNISHSWCMPHLLGVCHTCSVSATLAWCNV